MEGIISFDDFEKLDLRVAKVISAEDVPNADKIFKLVVDLGNETRTLVAGIKKYYTKEELIGKKIVLLANLEPRVIRGIESRGMLLAADDGQSIRILTVDGECAIGSRIR